MSNPTRRRAALALALGLAAAGQALAHGDVAPQPVDTSGLPDLGARWLSENPFRDPAGPYWERALQIGASGYNQNCARCHGLEVISGGLAPDLRFLEPDMDGDEWYLERMRHGATQNGITRMPAFEGIFGQEAMWAIRTYIETRPDEDTLAPHVPRLRALRDALAAGGVEPEAARAELEEIAAQIVTMSGAPVADSIARRAAKELAERGAEGRARAAEILTIGLPAHG